MTLLPPNDTPPSRSHSYLPMTLLPPLFPQKKDSDSVFPVKRVFPVKHLKDQNSNKNSHPKPAQSGIRTPGLR